MANDYTMRDVEVLYYKGNWSSWWEIVQWLQKYGDYQEDFTPYLVRRMIADFYRLYDINVPFTADYQQAYLLAKKYRG